MAKACAGLGSDVAILDVMEPQEDLSQFENYGVRAQYYK